VGARVPEGRNKEQRQHKQGCAVRQPGLPHGRTASGFVGQRLHACRTAARDRPAVLKCIITHVKGNEVPVNEITNKSCVSLHM